MWCQPTLRVLFCPARMRVAPVSVVVWMGLVLWLAI
jgi:hypothetical protein